MTLRRDHALAIIVLKLILFNIFAQSVADTGQRSRSELLWGLLKKTFIGCAYAQPLTQMYSMLCRYLSLHTLNCEFKIID